jgi:hypothetical protein
VRLNVAPIRNIGTDMNRYLPIKPQNFSVGDIVEIRVSFAVVPQFVRRDSGESFRLLVILHSLAMIDNKFTLVRDLTFI